MTKIAKLRKSSVKLLRGSMHKTTNVACIVLALTCGLRVVTWELGREVGFGGGYLGKNWEQASQHNEIGSVGEQLSFYVRYKQGEKELGKEELSTLAPSERAILIDTLSRSSYADTLGQIFGRPGITMTGETLPGASTAVGAYDRGLDQIFLSSELRDYPTKQQARVILAHEFGHAWQARQGAFIGRIWSEYKIGAPEEKLATYASMGRSEHQAEAVAAAMGVMDILARPELDQRVKLTMVSLLDKIVPGTIVLTRIFLSHPLYAKHPAQGLDPVLGLSPLSPPTSWDEVRTADPGNAQMRAANSVVASSTGLLKLFYSQKAQKEEALYLAGKQGPTKKALGRPGGLAGNKNKPSL